MSSRVPQKDGQPPCKTVILGLDGKPPEVVRAAGDKFNASISHFYNAARQNSDNSRGDVWQQHTSLPEGAGQVSYTSNQGMEIMTVRLSAKAVEELEESTKKSERTAWDWLVIDLEIPVKDDASPPHIHKLTAAARFYNPALPDIPDPSSDPDNPTPIFGGASLERFAVDNQLTSSSQQEPTNASEQARPRLMWGGAPRAEQIAAPEVETIENAFKCSLLVDIRPNFWVDTVSIDIWAQLDVWKLDKSLKAIVVRSPNIDPTLTYWFGDATVHYVGGDDTLDYITTAAPGIASGITDYDLLTSSSSLNRWIPYPYTYSNLTDSAATDSTNFTMSGLTWLNNNHSGTRELYGNQFSTLWHDLTVPYVWADGFWDAFTWGEFSDALGEIAGAAGTVNFSEPIAGLGVNYCTMNGGEFWAQLGSPHGFIWGFNDPGTPPPSTLGFDATSGGGAVGSAFFGFFNVWNTYIWKPSISAQPQSTTFTADCSIKAVALRGQTLDPPPPDSSSDGSGQLMWSQRDCVLATNILQAVTPDSTQNWRYGQWEQKGKYPDRWDMKIIDGAEAVEVDNQDDPDTTFIDNLKFLGRITFDQTGGGAKFSWVKASDIPADKLPVMP